MPRLQGLIFDLEGTLINSAADMRQALNKTLAADGRREMSLPEVENIAGDGLLPMMTRAYALTGAAIPDSESYNHFQKFIQHFRHQKSDPAQILPYVRETLEAYHGQGIKLGICTNRQEVSTNALLGDLDLKAYFSFIAGGDTFQVHKPNPGHVTGVIDGMGVATDGCVMIGDGSNDVRAAQGAGIPCLVITHGCAMDAKALGPDGIIESFKQLPEALAKLGF